MQDRGSGSIDSCTAGPLVQDKASGRKGFLTAGHCDVTAGAGVYTYTSVASGDWTRLGAYASADTDPLTTEDSAVLWLEGSAVPDPGATMIADRWPVAGVMPATEARALPIGTPVCIDGAFSHVRCGELVAAMSEISATIGVQGGDSGSTMFVVGEDGRATVIGIVARGDAGGVTATYAAESLDHLGVNYFPRNRVPQLRKSAERGQSVVMAPVIAPDPDMRLADSAARDKLRTLATSLSASADVVERQAAGLREITRSVTVEKKLASLAATRQALEQQSAVTLTTVELHADMSRAAADFRRDAPSKLEVGIAWAAMEDAREKMQTAAQAELPCGELREKLIAAENTHNLLVKRRGDAIDAFHVAEAAAVARYQKRLQSLGVKPPVETPEQRRGTPGKPAPTAPPAGKPSAPGPGSHVGAPNGKPAAPGTSLSTSPTTPSGSTPAQAAEIASLLAQQQAKQGQPVQIPQQAAPQAPPPTVAAPVAASAAKPTNDRKAGVVDNSLLDEIFNSGAPAAATLAATVPATVTPHAPAAPAAPVVVTPSTSGSSAQNLVTEADVSGRSEGPRTALSSAATENAKAAPASTSGTGTPAGQGVGQPMIPPMTGGGGGGGALAAKDPITRYDADGEILHGKLAQAEAVSGGTIAQRRDGGSAAA